MLDRLSPVARANLGHYDNSNNLFIQIDDNRSKVLGREAHFSSDITVASLKLKIRTQTTSKTRMDLK